MDACFYQIAKSYQPPIAKVCLVWLSLAPLIKSVEIVIPFLFSLKTNGLLAAPIIFKLTPFSSVSIYINHATPLVKRTIDVSPFVCHHFLAIGAMFHPSFHLSSSIKGAFHSHEATPSHHSLMDFPLQTIQLLWAIRP